MSDKPYPFQTLVADYLLQGKSVVLQAPTGSGKTAAALLPYIHARAKLESTQFPQRCVYAVPMRVLANQFEDAYKRILDDFNAQAMPIGRAKIAVRVQTGARAEDRQFEGNLIFTTIDQVLSNFLAIPYALSNGKANLNAAAVFGSYLVFDEFHLFPAEADGNGALGTTLEMLRWLKDITPFVLMTATFSSTMLDRLCDCLGVEKVTLSAEELAGLPSQQKTRRYQLVNQPLTAEAVLAAHTGRSIVICNTVGRAQQMYRDLCKAAGETGIEIQLLHARFLKKDREDKERWALREFGKDYSQRQTTSAILVATQVVEVGLDITCENLHTDLAPANSVLQRAGRCARYPGEVGTVHIYRLPCKEGQDQPDTAPYLGQRIAPLCQKTWDTFTAQLAEGPVLDYQSEMAVVDAVHTESDTELLDLLVENRMRLLRAMETTIAGPDRAQARSFAPDLIRDVDSIAVVPHHNPTQTTVPDPWIYDGFSLYRGSVRGQVQALLARAAALDLPWALRVPVAQEDASETSNYAPTRYTWLDITVAQDLAGHPRLFVHPDLVAYDDRIGFRFVLDDHDTAGFTLDVAPGRRNERPGAFCYVAENYGSHIHLLHDVYQHDHRDEIAWVAQRLEAQLGTPAGIVDQAVRLTLACHDVGKLTTAWQGWAHEWQRRIGHPKDTEILLAHTDYNPGLEQHRALDKELRGKRPHHAVEGAMAAALLVNGVFGGEKRLVRPVVSAIARHHNADSIEARAFGMDRYAQRTLQAALDELRAGEDWRISTATWKFYEATAGRKLHEGNGLIPYDARLEQFLYFLLVRVLRLCDGVAVELASQQVELVNQQSVS